jgi:hypothetical protein
MSSPDSRCLEGVKMTHKGEVLKKQYKFKWGFIYSDFSRNLFMKEIKVLEPLPIGI